MSTPDSIDKQLAILLGQDARQNSEELARKLNISAATVRRRLRRLVDSGLIRIVGTVDAAKFGYPLVAIINLDVDHNMTESVMEKLTEFKEIKWVSTSTGRYDILTLARFSTTAALSEFMSKELAQLDGVIDSETFICLDITKGKFIPLT